MRVGGVATSILVAFFSLNSCFPAEVVLSNEMSEDYATELAKKKIGPIVSEMGLSIEDLLSIRPANPRIQLDFRFELSEEEREHLILLLKKEHREWKDDWVYQAFGETENPLAAAFLHLTAFANKPYCVLILIAGGLASIDVADKAGNTALHLSTAQNHQKVIAALINLGANLEAKTLDGISPTKLAEQMDRRWGTDGKSGL